MSTSQLNSWGSMQNVLSLATTLGGSGVVYYYTAVLSKEAAAAALFTKIFANTVSSTLGAEQFGKVWTASVEITAAATCATVMALALLHFAGIAATAALVTTLASLIAAPSIAETITRFAYQSMLGSNAVPNSQVVVDLLRSHQSKVKIVQKLARCFENCLITRDFLYGLQDAVLENATAAEIARMNNILGKTLSRACTDKDTILIFDEKVRYHWAKEDLRRGTFTSPLDYHLSEENLFKLSKHAAYTSSYDLAGNFYQWSIKDEDLRLKVVYQYLANKFSKVFLDMFEMGIDARNENPENTCREFKEIGQQYLQDVLNFGLSEEQTIKMIKVLNIKVDNTVLTNTKLLSIIANIPNEYHRALSLKEICEDAKDDFKRDLILFFKDLGFTNQAYIEEFAMLLTSETALRDNLGDFGFTDKAALFRVMLAAKMKNKLDLEDFISWMNELNVKEIEWRKASIYKAAVDDQDSLYILSYLREFQLNDQDTKEVVEWLLDMIFNRDASNKDFFYNNIDEFFDVHDIKDPVVQYQMREYKKTHPK